MAPVPPRRLPDAVSGTGGLDALEYEALQEKAWNLARMGRRLELALRALAEFDAALPEGGAGERDRLVAAAGEALWYLVVQREACGLRDSEALMRELDVPREVRLRMGYVPPDRRR